MSIALIKQLLEQMLDPPKYQLYISKLRDWFSNGTSKEQLDNDLKSILEGDILELHNQLLREILAQSCGIVSADTIIRNSVSRIPEDGNETSFSDEVTNLPEAESLDSFHLKKGTTEDSDVVLALESSNRFPNGFMKEFYGKPDPESVLLNVTHVLPCIAENIEKNPDFRQLFTSRNGIILTSEASLYARFLMEAWKRNLESVEADALNFAIKATLTHIKTVITEVLKQAKAFRLRYDGCIHSVGSPYPNPYLRQGHHLYEANYCSDTAQLADTMQIPSYLPTQDERERLAALQVAAAVPQKFPHLRTKICLLDILDAIENNRNLIPNYHLRTKMYELILQKSKGYGDAYSMYTQGKDLVAKTVTSIALY